VRGQDADDRADRDRQQRRDEPDRQRSQIRYRQIR
jgi:hypothetical protein